MTTCLNGYFSRPWVFMTKEKTLGKIYIKAISLLWIGSILGAGCAFITQVLVARKLGPEGYGLLSAALTTTVLIAPLAGFGLQGFWLKVFGEEGWAGIRWIASSIRFVVFSTILSIFIIIAWAIFGPHELATTEVMLILTFHVSGLMIVELVTAKLLLEEKHTQVALWQLVPHVLRFTLVVLYLAFVNVGNDVNAISYIYALVALGVTIFGAMQVKYMFNGDFDLKGHCRNHSSIKHINVSALDVAKNAWPFGIAGILHLIYFQSNVVILKYMSGDEAAGVYNVAFSIMAAVYLFPGVVYQKFLLPKLHRWSNHNKTLFFEAYRKGNKAMFGLGCVAAVGIYIVSPWGIPFLFGIQYSKAVEPLLLLGACAPIRFLATSIGSMLITQQHMHTKVKLMGLVAVVNVPVNVVLISKYGLIGAAVSTLVSEVLLLSLYYVFVRKLVVRPYEQREMA